MFIIAINFISSKAVVDNAGSIPVRKTKLWTFLDHYKFMDVAKVVFLYHRKSAKARTGC